MIIKNDEYRQWHLCLCTELYVCVCVCLCLFPSLILTENHFPKSVEWVVQTRLNTGEAERVVACLQARTLS